MKIYGFAFSLHNISTKTLYGLENLDNKYLIFRNNIDKYLEKLKRDKPDYILGLGIYGRSSKYLHLETKCSNIFQKKYLNDEDSLIEEDITPFLKETEDMKYTDTLGNHLCNLMSYKVRSLITDGELNSKFTFIHIPKRFTGDAQRIINVALKRDL